jgi:rubredoxin
MRRYVCEICEHVYDPFEGEPESGIEAMTSFADLPFEWVCPECGAGRERFVLEESFIARRQREVRGGG